MKKTVFTVTACCVLLVAIIAMIDVPANASSTKSIAIADDFNSGSIDREAWITEGDVTVKDSGGAIQITGGEFASCVTWLGTDFSAGVDLGLSESYNLEFVASREMPASSWLSIFVGLDSIDLSFASISEEEGLYGNALVWNGSGIANYCKMGVLAKNSDGTDSVVNFSTKSDGTKYAVKFAATVGNSKENNKLDIYYSEWSEEQTNIRYTHAGTMTGLSLKGFFGFGSMSTGGTALISNIKVTKPDGTIIWQPKENLENQDIDHIYGSNAADTSKEFRVWNSYAGEKAEKYKTGKMASIQIKNGGSILSATDITAEKELLNAYEFEASVDVKKLGAGFDILLGKSGNKETALKFSGSQVSYNDKNYNLNTSITEGVTKLKLNVETNGCIDLYLDEKYVLTIENVMELSGKIGFRAGGNTDIIVDDITVTKFVLSDIASKSVSEDFTNLNNKNIPIVNTKNDWYIAGNAFLVEDGVLFVNADQTAFFGTKQEYSDYVVKFRLNNISQGAVGSTPSCSWIGMSVGRKSQSDTYADATTITFAPRDVNDKVGKMCIESIGKGLFDTGGTVIDSSYNFFEDFDADETKQAADVMLVVNNRTVTLYFKYDNEPESALTIPRAVIRDVDTEGYFSICTSYYGNFNISNISVTNLSTDKESISDYVELPADRQDAGDKSVTE